jgi:hypothetical protein
LPDVPTHQVVVDPRNPQNIYVGTDLGVMVSTDAGLTWAHDPNAFSDVIVEALALDNNSASNWLFAFSYGRGAYKVQLPNAARPTVPTP